MATQKQIDFITKLIIQKEMPKDLHDRLTLRLSSNDLDGMTASKTIDWLMKQPNKAGQGDSHFGAGLNPRLKALEDSVPEGHYALELKVPDSAGNKVHFYSVDKPGVDSKWNGRTFVNMEVGGREDIPIKNPAIREQILTELAVDPQASMQMYGRLIGRCGACGRKLTNDESRAYGIGPECRSKGLGR